MTKLPPGQRVSEAFPRFGIPKYAYRFPKEMDHISITIGGDLEDFEISDQINELTRVEQVSDFHCVTTWSVVNLKWSGYLFSEFYTKLIKPKLPQEISFVILKGQDGYKTSLPLADLIQQNVLLADRLNDQPLTMEHGAPVRIVAPDHYGYKNLKHLNRLEFYTEEQKVKQGILSFMDHPRARVVLEERARTGPSIFFRWLYKKGVKGTIRTFEEATAKYKMERKSTEKVT